jgi:AP-1 complex subunit beta-1
MRVDHVSLVVVSPAVFAWPQNPAVVLSAVKIVMMFMEVIASPDTIASFCRKLAPPLITLAQSAAPEVQYVALRNINIIVQKRPNLLSHKIKVFFCVRPCIKMSPVRA